MISAVLVRTTIFLTMILSAGILRAGDPVDCVYLAKKDNEIKEYKSCGNIADEKVSLSKKHLEQVAFDSHGLATVLVQGQYYYVKPDGSMLPVVAFDNWADDYSEGLVRSPIDGKIAFYDRNFRQVIAPKYDWAAPFRDGKALVCKGCRTQPADADGHMPISGGTWGYINREGEEIVSVRHTREEAEKRKFRLGRSSACNGEALAEPPFCEGKNE